MADDTYQAYRGARAAMFSKNIFSSLQLIATSPAHQSLDAFDATQIPSAIDQSDGEKLYKL